MGTAITWLIAFFVVSASAFTAVTSVLSMGSSRAESISASDERLIEELETSVQLVSAGLVNGSGNKQIDIVVTNDGRRALGEFEEWDVAVRYDRSGSASEIYVMLDYSASAVDDSWTDQSFWLDYDSTQGELIETGRLNVHEEMVIRVQFSTKIQGSTPVVVTITTPVGVTETIIFQS